MHFSTQSLNFLLHVTSTWLFLFMLLFPFPLCFSDPRISESGHFCGANKAPTSSFVPTFVKEMENLSQIITNNHFATYHVNVSGSIGSTIYALVQCHRDLSQTDCLLCYAASRTKLPRCLPSVSARIYLDGCFLRYENYSFYQEFVSDELDSVKCSSENLSSSDHFKNEKEFIKSVGYAVGNVTGTALRNRGFGVAEVKGVYALAQCWESVDKEGCRECLEKAGNEVSGCGGKREGRGMNTGCYLRYSTQSFFNDDAESGNSHGKNNFFFFFFFFFFLFCA